MLTRSVERVGIAALSFLTMYGMISAFIALDSSSFWVDELFTGYVIGTDHDLGNVFARALNDGHPPIYALLVFLFSEIFGASEFGLRLFSAASCVSALLVFFAGTRPIFGLPARLFAMSLATVSQFWVYQSQNARSYGLCLLLGSLILYATVKILDTHRNEASQRYAIIALFASCLIATFTHFYMLFVSIGALLALFVFVKEIRPLATALSLALAGLLWLYLKTVVEPNSFFDLGRTWVGSGQEWYRLQMASAVDMSFTKKKALVFLLLTAFAMSLVTGYKQKLRVTALLFGFCCFIVILSVIGLGVVSSAIMSPNFTDRNVLLVSPFIWGLVALAYDLATQTSAKVQAVTVVLATTLVGYYISEQQSRLLAKNEPFRETAEFINAFEPCRGQSIPVFVNRVSTLKPGKAEYLARWYYGYYLNESIRVEPFFIEDVLSGSAKPRSSCPIAGWVVHFSDSITANRLANSLSRVQHRPVSVKEYRVPGNLGGWSPRGYVFLVESRLGAAGLSEPEMINRKTN